MTVLFKPEGCKIHSMDIAAELWQPIQTPCLLPHQLWSLVIPGHSRCGRSSFLTTLHCIMWWNNVARASGNPVHPISIQTPPGSQKDLGPHAPCSAGLGEHSSQAPVMAGRPWTHCLSVQVGNKSLWKVTWRMSTPEIDPQTMARGWRGMPSNLSVCFSWLNCFYWTGFLGVIAWVYIEILIWTRHGKFMYYIFLKKLV